MQRSTKTRAGVTGAVTAVLIAGMMISGETAAQAKQAGRADSALTLPVTPNHGVARAQIFEPDIPDKSVYDGKVDFVWGADSQQEPSGVVPSCYNVSNVVDHRYWPQYSLTWFQQNHPDWIEYQNDRTTPAYAAGETRNPPLNMADPDVQQWFFDHTIQPHVDQGWKIIALDNVITWNIDYAAGHYDSSGTWVQQYTHTQTSDLSHPAGLDDPAYASDTIGLMNYYATRLHDQGVAAAVNAYLPKFPTDFEFEQAQHVNDLADIVLDEGGFTPRGDVATPADGNGISDANWANRFMFDRAIAASGKPLVVIDETAPPNGEQAPTGQVDYSVANYFLYRGGDTMLFEGAGYGDFPDRSELDADIGVATSDPAKESNGVWQRQYSNGMTLVNPSSSATVTVTLPPGSWTDLDGNTVTGSVTLGPTEGTVLTASPNSTCSSSCTSVGHAWRAFVHPLRHLVHALLRGLIDGRST